MALSQSVQQQQATLCLQNIKAVGFELRKLLETKIGLLKRCEVSVKLLRNCATLYFVKALKVCFAGESVCLLRITFRLLLLPLLDG